MKKQDPNDLGALLRRVVDSCCNREGITQAEVARRSGLDPSSLNRSFHHPAPGPALRAVCNAFGLKIEAVPNSK